MSLFRQPYLQPLKPLALTWKMKNLESAKLYFEHLPGGLVQMIIQHQRLDGVTPAMLVHWFRHLIIGSSQYYGEMIDNYRLWHPVDHIAVSVVTPAPSGQPGFSQGARIRIQECLVGQPSYSVDNVMLVERMDHFGITLRGNFAGLEFARLEHRFIEVERGTLYHTQLRLGTLVPGFSTIARCYIRRLMSESKARAWLKHNVQEVGNFQFFLPEMCLNDPKFNNSTEL